MLGCLFLTLNFISTSSSKQHIEQYFSTGDLPQLTEEEVAAIDAADAKGTPCIS
jgi:diketogulonate reductase-like aldo/keto reductase